MDAELLTGICKLQDKMVMLLDLNKIMLSKEEMENVHKIKEEKKGEISV